MAKRKRSNGSNGNGNGKRHTKKPKTRKGFSSVARTRGAPVQGEMKLYDTFLAPTAIPSVAAWTGTEFDPATLNTLFVPVVGAGVNQRIGKSVKVMKIKITGCIFCAAQIDATAADQPTVVRLILHQDMQTNSAQAQGEQVMQPTTNAGEAPFTYQNNDNFGRFKVLKDKLISLQNPAISWDGTNMEQNALVKTFKITKIFKEPVEIRFNNTNGGTVADIVDNSFHVIANSFNATLVPQITYYARINYKE